MNSIFCNINIVCFFRSPTCPINIFDVFFLINRYPSNFLYSICFGSCNLGKISNFSFTDVIFSRNEIYCVATYNTFFI